MKKRYLQIDHWYCGKSRYVRRIVWIGDKSIVWRTHDDERGASLLRSFCKWAIEDLGMNK